MGTLLGLHPPVPRLAAALAAAGHPTPDEAVAHALRAEIAHYKTRMHTGADAASLAALHAECVEVLASRLPDPPPPERLLPMLLDSLSFHAHPDALALLDALDAQGIPAVVVSNWDWALPAHLDRIGILGRFAGVVASASAGVEKPEPGIFGIALRLAGAEPDEAVHCGDDPVCDLHGAARAGVRGVLLDRTGRFPRESPRIASLVDLPGTWAPPSGVLGGQGGRGDR
ncbi:MAG: HAD-IA family hydrolase [Thermoleophilia bacterium]|nr:HAD-IA family hydrolase [Thermoleophilia bacterium]